MNNPAHGNPMPEVRVRFQLNIKSVVETNMSPVTKIVVCFLFAGILATCGQRDDHDRALEKVAADERDHESAGGVPNEQVLDTLRAMKERFNITRETYWNNKGGVLANDFFEVWYPPGYLTVTQGMLAFGKLVDAQKKFRRIFGSDPGDRLVVICSATMAGYTEQTGLEWFVYAKVDGDEVHYQPIGVLVQRTLADCAVPRGYFEWGILRLSKHRAPQWLTQGFASLLSDEEKFLEDQLREFSDDVKMTLEEINLALENKNDRKAYRLALYDAYRMVRRLTAHHDRDKITDVIRLMGNVDSVADAFEKTFDRSYEEVVSDAMDFKVNQ
jgi:hypothetical protein